MFVNITVILPLVKFYESRYNNYRWIKLSNPPHINSIKNYYDKECAICLETECVYNLVKLNCGHEFCGQCITQVLKTNKNKKSINCALCRDKVNTIDVNSFKVYDLMVNNCIL